MEPRIEQFEPFTVVGLKFPADRLGWNIVPTLFYRLIGLYPRIAHPVDDGTCYGISYRRSGPGGTDEMWYVAGVEVSSVDELPEGFVSHTVPAGEYAVFPARGGLAGIGPAYHFLSDQWMPSASYKEARSGAIEVYGPRFAPDTNGEFEIRIAIEPKA